jgi:hypothetical protein
MPSISADAYNPASGVPGIISDEDLQNPELLLSGFAFSEQLMAAPRKRAVDWTRRVVPGTAEGLNPSGKLRSLDG